MALPFDFQRLFADNHFTRSQVDKLRALYAKLGEDDQALLALIAQKADKAITIGAGPGLLGGGDLSANRTLSLDMSYLRGSFKNYIINGDHRWWQRGTTAGTLVSSRMLADRFTFASNGNTLSSNRQVFAIGQTAVPGNPIFFQRVSIDGVSGISNAYAVYFQRVENLSRFSGKTVTFSWYAKADAPRDMSLELIYQYGTGGSASEAMNAPTKYALTTQWQRFSQTVTIPSMVGKTHNMTDSHLIVHFWLAAGTDASYQERSAGLGNTAGIVDIACIQMEDGDHATDFEFLPPSMSLILCQRYYEKSFNAEIAPAANTSATFASGMHMYRSYQAGAVGITWQVPFAVRKRSPPALTIYNPQAVNNQVRNASAGLDCTDTSTFPAEGGFVVNASQPGGAIVGNAYWIHWVADSEL